MAISSTELNSIVSAVLSAVRTNSRTIEELTPVTSLSPTDSIEIGGGKRVTFATLSKLLTELGLPDGVSLTDVLQQLQQSLSEVKDDVDTLESNALTLGYTSTKAFPGNEGLGLKTSVNSLCGSFKILPLTAGNIEYVSDSGYYIHPVTQELMIVKNTKTVTDPDNWREDFTQYYFGQDGLKFRKCYFVVTNGEKGLTASGAWENVGNGAGGGSGDSSLAGEVEILTDRVADLEDVVANSTSNLDAAVDPRVYRYGNSIVVVTREVDRTSGHVIVVQYQYTPTGILKRTGDYTQSPNNSNPDVWWGEWAAFSTTNASSEIPTITEAQVDAVEDAGIYKVETEGSDNKYFLFHTQYKRSHNGGSQAPLKTIQYRLCDGVIEVRSKTTGAWGDWETYGGETVDMQPLTTRVDKLEARAIVDDEQNTDIDTLLQTGVYKNVGPSQAIVVVQDRAVFNLENPENVSEEVIQYCFGGPERTMPNGLYYRKGVVNGEDIEWSQWELHGGELSKAVRILPPGTPLNQVSQGLNLIPSSEDMASPDNIVIFNGDEDGQGICYMFTPSGLKTCKRVLNEDGSYSLTLWEDFCFMESITYGSLKIRRDSARLVPGKRYRITNFVTKVANDPEAKSAGHPFDLIVLATSENTLSEEAQAVPHAGDTYFAHCNMAAWKVWYCLDNDTSRFRWADETNGRGVIYRLIDEYNNDCPYDFKNVQFKRYKVTVNLSNAGDYMLQNRYMGVNHDMYGLTAGSDWVWCYTFHLNSHNNCDITIQSPVDYGYQAFDCRDNRISPSYGTSISDDNSEVSHFRCLNNITLCSKGGRHKDIVIGQGCFNISLGDVFSISIANECAGIILGDASGQINIGVGCSKLTFASATSVNIGNFCTRIASPYSEFINIGDVCSNISVIEDVHNLDLGEMCTRIVITSGWDVKIGSNCSDIEFETLSYTIDIKSECHYIFFTDSGYGVGFCNWTVLAGTQGTNESWLVMDETIPENEIPTVAKYAGLNSKGDLAVWSPADAHYK